jgi:hypothetical protein
MEWACGTYGRRKKMYSGLGGKDLKKRGHFGKFKRGREDNIKMNLK